MVARIKRSRRKWKRRPKVAEEDRKRARPKAPYFCYGIVSVTDPTKSYVGFASQCARRRLLEHNSEKSKTKGTRDLGPWRLFVIVGGFQTHEEALQFEWRWQFEQRVRGRKPSKMGKGEAHTKKALKQTMALDRWTKKAPLASTVQLTVEHVGQDE